MQVALSWMRDPRLVEAAAPLLDDGVVGALSWTIEHGFGPVPDTVSAVLDRFAGSLVGHGVHLSPASPWDGVSADWLRRARAVVARWPVRWLTEHYGILRAGGVHAAPLPLPPNTSHDRAAVDALRRVSDALGVPVGLENLALASSADDARRQADRLGAIVHAVDGVVVLDLHNLWCQAVNYRIDVHALASRYPLGRVREVHVAGGRWDDLPAGRFRRDTHDGPVPEPVWALLDDLLPELPAVEVLTLERMPDSVSTDVVGWREEVRRLADVAARPREARDVRRWRDVAVPACADLPDAAAGALLHLFTGDGRPRGAGDAARWLATWDDRALAVAADVVRRYGRRVAGGS